MVDDSALFSTLGAASFWTSLKSSLPDNVFWTSLGLNLSASFCLALSDVSVL